MQGLDLFSSFVEAGTLWEAELSGVFYLQNIGVFLR